ncbi:MAG: putative virion core protein (lumpy skin disease virus)-like protein [Bacteroidetes bacterium]|jgi:membrane protease subunit (stomatin/prohibitin family)|nr:putative virion core protein (lumpy skin disease virus)-like protein [Bacteroidota bacterium]
MGLFDKIKNEFIDIIEWLDNTNDTIVWKFPRYQNEIKMGAKLTVRESQVAVFMNEGKIADVFQPGMHTLQTQNMPIMSTLKGWKYGFNSPFKADIFFVSTKQFIDQKWGTKNPITLSDPRFGFIELRSFGSFAFRVTDAAKFIKEIAGTDENFSTEEVTNQLKSLIVTKFTDAVGEGNIPVEKFAANMEELSKLGHDKLNNDFTEYGLTITKFLVENVSMPEELKKEIFNYSRLNAIDMNKLAQFNTANAIKDAAKNEGLGGAGIGMGVGMGMGNMMSNMMTGMNNNAQNNMGMNTPPPIIQFHVVVNGAQAGPFNLQQLQQMAAAGQLTRATMVWKAGLANWATAESQPELASLFMNTPPPIM